MRALFTLLLACSFGAFAQKIHLPHEVEKVAEPAGGNPLLTQFINTNLQVPFKSAFKGINGRVYVKAVVETDGSVSNVEVARGIDSLCNQEALRVFKLYQAWKPATVKGEPVRQSISYPVTFKIAPQAGYDSTSKAIVEYYDGKYAPSSDPNKAEYRKILPVDETGFVARDVVYENRQGNKWKRMGAAAFARNNGWFRSDYLPANTDSIQVYSISARDQNMASHAAEGTFQMNGRLLEYTEYGANNKAYLHKLYDLNGMVRELQLYTDSVKTEVKWYENGQIKSVTEIMSAKPTEIPRIVYLDAWKKDGTQLTKAGEGTWAITEKTYNGKWLTENGRITAGGKTGKWTGKWADSTLHYEELYENGTLQKGIAYHDGAKSEYTEPQVQPEFKGGLNSFYRFLGMNIKYPTEASRRGVTGRVQLSFVVCEDGSLCEYKVEKSAGFGLDEEALRVVKKMDGHWVPGEMRGKPVRVRYNVPINFQMD
ncbi:energy transducer TonB [Dyadobacter sp. Leaf189]|uniref:energy transducer TonB n=1 Tax=Dyadobacter sp. Leaf189 TaxID=1736295 RepID=UPI0006F75775|nr:energy transducer TonB [Dyadobacter sp. Leaf189]KQS25424.1 energy transducer TonB [Dyadobacter sp. Leaf189]